MRTMPKEEPFRVITDEMRVKLVLSMKSLLKSDGKVDLEKAGFLIGFSKDECKRLRDDFTESGLIRNLNGYGDVTVTSRFDDFYINGVSNSEDRIFELSKEECSKIDEILLKLNESGKFEVYPNECSKDEYATTYVCARYIKDNNLAETCVVQNYNISLFDITNDGIIFLRKGGMTSIHDKNTEENNRDERIKDLEEKNLNLQNESYGYEKKMRKWKAISGILAIIISIMGIVIGLIS